MMSSLLWNYHLWATMSATKKIQPWTPTSRGVGYKYDWEDGFLVAGVFCVVGLYLILLFRMLRKVTSFVSHTAVQRSLKRLCSSHMRTRTTWGQLKDNETIPLHPQYLIMSFDCPMAAGRHLNGAVLCQNTYPRITNLEAKHWPTLR